jgi:hypothetical protein
MKLYHGSNCEVKKPRIITNLRALDFGTGFYLTSSETQAIRWARIVTKRRRLGEPILNVYEFGEEKTNTLKVLKFETANEALKLLRFERSEIL